MKLSRISVWLGLAVLAACSRTPPELQLIEDAATALGGVDRVQAVTSLVLEGEGTQYNLGQDLRPEARGQTFTVSAFRRAIDLAGARTRTELTRAPDFSYFQGPAPQQQRQGFDNGVAWNIAADGAANRAADTVATDRRAEFFHHPVVAVRAALDPQATRGRTRSEGREIFIEVTTADGQRFTLAVGNVTKLPTRVITASYHPNLGDVAISTSFEDYVDAGGLKMPSRLTTRVDEFTTTELRLASHGVNADAGDLAAPADVTAAAAITAPPPPNVAVEPLAKGIWRLGGQSHHSVLVELKDEAVLIEAPQNEQRTLAVIAKARELLPNKPLTKLVTTHHHFDHTAGLRAAIAEGLTIITHDGNASYFERLAERPHTIVQDHLAKNPKPARVETIGASRSLTDGTRTLQLIPVSGPHSETMLVAWLPQEALLVEADLYSPGGAAQPFAAKFLEDVRTLKLTPGRIVPLHGAVVPFAQFVKEAGAAPTG